MFNNWLPAGWTDTPVHRIDSRLLEREGDCAGRAAPALLWGCSCEHHSVYSWVGARQRPHLYLVLVSALGISIGWYGNSGRKEPGLPWGWLRPPGYSSTATESRGWGWICAQLPRKWMCPYTYKIQIPTLYKYPIFHLPVPRSHRGGRSPPCCVHLAPSSCWQSSHAQLPRVSPVASGSWCSQIHHLQSFLSHFTALCKGMCFVGLHPASVARQALPEICISKGKWNLNCFLICAETWTGNYEPAPFNEIRCP